MKRAPEKYRKRLVMNISPALHKKIKMTAAKRNMTITQYVLEAVVFRLSQEKP